MASFNYDSIPIGYYDEVTRTGNAIRRAWHLSKFSSIRACLAGGGSSILDVGCFAGTFLGGISETEFSYQVGVDILGPQIQYARTRYGTHFRKFIHAGVKDWPGAVDGTFDAITAIEVIEHLTAEEICDLLTKASAHLRSGGRLILSTPNYASAWPVVETIVNWLSTVTYEEQHISRFNYFNVEKKLRRIYPEFDKNYNVEFKTTTHFLAPFLAKFAFNFALRRTEKLIETRKKFPFGCLTVLVLNKI